MRRTNRYGQTPPASFRLEKVRRRVKSANRRGRERPMPRKAIGHIAQMQLDQSVCAGCGTCEVICATVHEGDSGPRHKRLWIERNEFEGFAAALTCHQCDDPECYYACEFNALQIDPVKGARWIDEEKCHGCRMCIEACVFPHPRINNDSTKNRVGASLKCDLCKDRPDGPACVEFCPQKALFKRHEEDGDE